MRGTERTGNVLHNFSWCPFHGYSSQHSIGIPQNKAWKTVAITWLKTQKVVCILLMEIDGVRSTSGGAESSRVWRTISVPLCTVLFICVGILHFAKTPVFLRIMPPQIPFPLELVYLSGIIEILGGLGLLWPSTRSISVKVLLLLLVAVFPANIHMALTAEKFPEIPYWLLYARLPFQAVLALWVWSCRDSAQD